MRTLVSRGLIGSIFNTRNDLRVEEERMDCSALSIMTRRLSNHEEKLPISVLVDYPIDGDGPTYIMTSTTLGLLRLSLPSFAELPSTPIVVLYTRRVCPYPTIQLLAVLLTPRYNAKLRIAFRPGIRLPNTPSH